MVTKKSYSKKRILLLAISFVVMLGLLVGFFGPSVAQAWGLVPVTSIVSVNTGVSVTVSGANFPAGQVFTVRMGPYGTYGVGGTVVGSYDTSAGTSFTTTYAIPGALASADRIAIRFESSSGYFSYNWFNNTATGAPTALPAGPTPVPGYVGYPTFSITSVAAGSTVTVQTQNMPAGQAFTVRMGDFGTLGIGGTVVGTTPTTGGSYSLTLNIPSWLAAKSQIAIRMDGPNGYYYAFNWFYNNSTTVASTPVPGSTPVVPTSPAVPGYVGIPTISIASVVRDSTVTVYGYNFPAGQTFNVRMGPYGSYGMGGTVVATLDSGAGGSFSATYSIPASLAGSQQIAVRLETANGFFYAYNWFWNNTTN
ncbi:MAG: hypothetical protein GYA58_02570 [Anaerolineaceae bacterium]|nr:hypothetical protein [Anaerolineaceae bacterium]